MLNNTGNFDFFNVNITAYDLIGVTDPNTILGAGNFTINVTDAVAGSGMQLQNGTSRNITDASLGHKTSASDFSSNLTLFFWLDVPIGLTVQDYNSTIWEIIVE